MNEDFCFASLKPIGGLNNLFVVCDGMGGHNAGEYASSIAVAQMLSAARKSTPGRPFEILGEGIREANEAIYQRAMREPDKAGMGTTLVAATIYGSTLYVVNVGDSRLYVQNNTDFWQVTRDHSYVAEMVRKGLLDKREARFHRDRNKITRAVGVLASVRPDYFDLELSSGMQVLLCTDGLTGMLYDEEIFDIICHPSDTQHKVNALIHQANERGGRDNITAILIEV